MAIEAASAWDDPGRCASGTGNGAGRRGAAAAHSPAAVLTRQGPQTVGARDLRRFNSGRPPGETCSGHRAILACMPDCVCI